MIVWINIFKIEKNIKKREEKLLKAKVIAETETKRENWTLKGSTFADSLNICYRYAYISEKQTLKNNIDTLILSFLT